MSKLNEIASIISAYTGIGIEEIQGRNRKMECAFARQLFCYFVRDKTKISSTPIAKYLNRYNSSIERATWKIKGLIEVEDFYVCKAVNDINKIIK